MTPTSDRPRLLDLFCGAGGAAMGYHRAGFDIVGVDVRPQPRYPFRFWQADALELEGWVLQAFDAVHASPPCQAYSVLRRANGDRPYADLVAPTRELLERSGRPWVMENVQGAPLRPAIMLCGSAVGLGAVTGGGADSPPVYRQLRRHRLFESSLILLQPPCGHEGATIGVHGGGPVDRALRAADSAADLKKRRGGYQGTLAEKRAAMGIPWANSSELNQAIPPAYTELIGYQLMAAL